MLDPAVRLVVWALVIAAAISPGQARAGEVSKPFPGVTLVRRAGEAAMVVVDLCAPGVSVRATKYAERKATPAGWAQPLGLEVAQNADFFDYPGWTYVVGRARGGGQDWPANAQQKEGRPYWQFGAAQALGVANGATPPVAGITEIVGGHNVIISGGASTGPWAPANDGELLNTLHERSAVGISADGRKLYLMSTVKSVSATTVVSWLKSMASEAGAPPIHFATNQDGGGSSQLFVKGLGQVVDSGRLVNNHLGIAAKGAGASPQCNNAPPKGFLDEAGCETIVGWAQDPTEPDAVISVHLTFNAPAGDPAAVSATVAAGVHREDLCMAIGSCKHGFRAPTPISLLDGAPHDVHAYGIDSETGLEKQLASSPRTLMCAPPPLEGVRRHVPNPMVLAAWKFSMFADMLTVDDELLAGLPESIAIPEAPALIRADDGSPEVWLVDGLAGEVRRHIPNPEVAAAWRLNLAVVTVRPALEVAALLEGPPLRPR
ncbi:MAG: phosphodiester glycosidase family protein, partial [Nannocystis sp.]|nr:phosphodiester glycosidase family protein [Nannocystis sp.]